MDCILGYHLNPISCGVAKFNLALSEKIGVPVVSVFDPTAMAAKSPLLSIKISEFTYNHARDLNRFLDERPATQSLRLFFHAYDDTEIERRLVAEADIIFVGNSELARRLRAVRPDVVDAWCPGAVFDAAPFEPTDLSVMTFGMAHKVRGNSYRRLDELLKATGKSYSLYLSTALHEGTAVEFVFSAAVESIRRHFSGPVHFLGFLSDAAMMHYLRNTTYFAAFFPTGVRANNSSVQTALSAGSVVITNLDGEFPKEFVHMESVIDLASTTALPTSDIELARISKNALRVADRYDWDKLVDFMMSADNQSATSRRAAAG